MKKSKLFTVYTGVLALLFITLSAVLVRGDLLVGKTASSTEKGTLHRGRSGMHYFHHK